jgi:hypothetical protein
MTTNVSMRELFDGVGESLKEVFEGAKKELKALGENPSLTDVYELQATSTMLTIMADAIANVAKNLSDSCKNCVQKI